jgi:putative salt-induced outer membrane protein
MIRSIRQPLLLAAGLFAMPLAHADDAPPPPVGWTGKGEVGAVLSRGNADTTTADVKFDGSDSFGNWKETAHLAFLYGESADFSTAQRLEGAWQTDYNYSKNMFVFGSIVGEDDRFDGFVYQATLATGLGYKVVDSDTTKLTLTAGIGYRRLQTETLIKDDDGRVIGRDPGPSASDGVGTVGLDYSQQITKTTKLVDRLAIQSGGQNTAVANDFSIAVNMTQALALSFGFGVRYNSQPSVGSKSTDELTTINLVYAFNQPKNAK